MDIKQLWYFVKVCEHGSFTKAGQQIYITQQALSKAIISLEKELGIILFHRTKQGLVLTEIGKTFKDNADKVLTTFNELETKIQPFRQKQFETVRFGINIGLAYYINPSLMAGFSEQYPNISLDYQEYTTEICMEMINQNKLNMALVLGPVEDNSFDSILLKQHNMMAIINKNNPLSQKDKLTLTDLKNQKLITNSKKNTDNLLKICRISGFEPQIIYSTVQSLLVYYLCSMNNYIGFSVDYFATTFANNQNGIISLPFEDNIYRWELYIITKKERPIKQATKNFIEYIIQYFIDQNNHTRSAIKDI